MTSWAMTIDCADAGLLARFWAEALGYEPAAAPTGYASWEAWFDHFDVPVEERDGVVSLRDPTGAGPGLSFLVVPEPKTVKNRLHLDLKVSGGRHVPWQRRWPLVLAGVEGLPRAGATVLRQHDHEGRGDHVVMADPEGNEFCVL